jgi:hypothetical protein
MSMLIEQTQSEMQDSHAFSRRAEIVGVRVSSAAFSVPNLLPLEIEEALSVGIRFVPQGANIAHGCVHATTLFECIISDSSESETRDPVAKFECCLTATYQLQDSYVPTESELNAFHKANVIFNCWPFFREFIQSSASRMNIPPPPVPFIRVHVLPDETPSTALVAPRKRIKKALKDIDPK